MEYINTRSYLIVLIASAMYATENDDTEFKEIVNNAIDELLCLLPSNLRIK